jgi:hypothetical protein
VLVPSPIKRDIPYQVDRTDATTSSHEHAQANPLLVKQGKKPGIDDSFQHPSILRLLCIIAEQVCEQAYTAHVTHSLFYLKPISRYDDSESNKSYIIIVQHS